MKPQLSGGKHRDIRWLGGWIWIALLFPILFTFGGCKAPYELKTAEGFAIEKYLGVWHQIALLPNHFQKDCFSNTQAEYTYLDSTSISVLNSCRTKSGQKLSASGIAIAERIPANFARLKVSFVPKWLNLMPFVWGDYWIIEIDSKYSSVLVGSPNRKYLWILSRDRFIQKEVFQKYMRVAKEQGFDVSSLVYELSALR